MKNKYLIIIPLALLVFFLLLPEPEVNTNATSSSEPKNPDRHSDNADRIPMSDNVTTFKAGVINDFNQQIYSTNMGTGIGESTDQLMGGKSIVELELINSPDNALLKWLKVSGEVKSGFIFPWSGLSYLLGNDQLSGVNLSKIKSLRFKAKGNEKTKQLSVLLFQSTNIRPIQKDINITETWQDFNIELAKINSLNTADVANISIVRAQRIGKFEFMIDDLRFE